MAVTFTEKALRAVQNAFSLHKAIFSEHAEYGPSPNLPSESCCTYVAERCDFLTPAPCSVCLGVLVAMVHANHMEVSLLDR